MTSSRSKKYKNIPTEECIMIWKNACTLYTSIFIIKCKVYLYKLPWNIYRNWYIWPQRKLPSFPRLKLYYVHYVPQLSCLHYLPLHALDVLVKREKKRIIYHSLNMPLPSQLNTFLYSYCFWDLKWLPSLAIFNSILNVLFSIWVFLILTIRCDVVIRVIRVLALPNLFVGAHL